MSLTKPIPKQAMEAVEFIRWWVPKPKRLPEPFKRTLDDRPLLRWPMSTAKTIVALMPWWYGECCPLGLCPTALAGAPSGASSAGMISDGDRAFRRVDKSVHSFIHWWDQQNDPKAAVEAVWG